MREKAPYLNTPFFVARAAGFFLLWIAFAAFFVRHSLRQDAGQAGGEATLRMRRLSAPFLVLFGLTVTFASFDWLMSLDPHWFSTIFGVYIFSGMTVTALGSGLVRGDHLYSLGALLFAFTCFWAYIAFSQYMLIWYGNIPEETAWFVHRTEHGWQAVSVLLAFVRFVVPFFLLLGRRAKSDPRSLAVASVLVLVGQLVDLYWIIMPGASPDGPRLGWQELGPALLLAGLLLARWGSFLSRHRIVAVGDPMFPRSREFHLP